ncbi:uncharacterized protein At1g08160-like [Arachis duranensis]|uniref:Uncharacterized protein At1g08160-like n=3 Tax=Arachis TaxID=3817 RepID=A0A9C6TEY0_ARADU|nr:uncharacterized protein At1g08160-like [Arachis duranensis]
MGTKSPRLCRSTNPASDGGGTVQKLAGKKILVAVCDSSRTPKQLKSMQEPSRTATGYPAPPFNHPNGGQPPPPSTTAYPYAAPPPYQPHPQYYNPQPYQQRYSPSRSFFRAFIATMICLAVVFGVVLIITWLVLRPSLPHFTITTFSVQNFSTTAQTVSATWHLTFLLRNNNHKMSVTYNVLRPSLFYHSNYLADSQLPPFKQDTRSENTLNATLVAVDAYLEPRAVTDLNAEKSSGSVTFDVQLLASASFRSGSWRFRPRVLKVLCRKVPVGLTSKSSSGQLVGGSRECQVWT